MCSCWLDTLVEPKRAPQLKRPFLLVKFYISWFINKKMDESEMVYEIDDKK